MANNENASVIIDKLSSYLKLSPWETYFQKDLILKIQNLSEKFAKDWNWYIQTMLNLF